MTVERNEMKVLFVTKHYDKRIKNLRTAYELEIHKKNYKKASRIMGIIRTSILQKSRKLTNLIEKIINNWAV